MEMLHIDKYMWGTLLLLVFANAARRALYGEVSQRSDVIFGVCLGWGLLLISLGILVYCNILERRVGNINEIVHAESTNFDLKNYFFLRRPNLIFKIMQVETFLQAFYLSLFSLALADDIANEFSPTLSAFLVVFTLLPPFINVLVLVPAIMPVFVLCTSTYNLTDEELVESTYKEVLKMKRQSIIGFSFSKKLDELEDSEQYEMSVYRTSLYGVNPEVLQECKAPLLANGYVDSEVPFTENGQQ